MDEGCWKPLRALIRVKWQSFEWISRLAELHHDSSGVFRLYVHRFRASSRFVPVYYRPGPAPCDLPHSRVRIWADVLLLSPGVECGSVGLEVPWYSTSSGLRSALHICSFRRITSTIWGLEMLLQKDTTLNNFKCKKKFGNIYIVINVFKRIVWGQ